MKLAIILLEQSIEKAKADIQNAEIYMNKHEKEFSAYKATKEDLERSIEDYTRAMNLLSPYHKLFTLCAY